MTEFSMKLVKRPKSAASTPAKRVVRSMLRPGWPCLVTGASWLRMPTGYASQLILYSQLALTVFDASPPEHEEINEECAGKNCRGKC